MESNGWKTQKIISDFPVEWYLANPSSNYNKNKNIGKSAHESRMFIENFLHSNQSIKLDDLTNFYESMAKIGQGRQLIGLSLLPPRVVTSRKETAGTRSPRAVLFRCAHNCQQATTNNIKNIHADPCCEDSLLRVTRYFCAWTRQAIIF